jgi:cyclopropane-fatty-acyl-phospholipid synthase
MTVPFTPSAGAWPAGFAASIVRRLLGRPRQGSLVVELPSGERLQLDGLRPGPQAEITLHGWRFLRHLTSGWDIGFAEAWMAGEVSSPDLVALLTLAGSNGRLEEPLVRLRLPRVGLRLRHARNRNSRRGSRRNIAAHYDLGNDFYAHWLDAGMSYSSGLFSSPTQTLEEAQEAKIDRVIELLALRDGERVLEIGCGWGGLAEGILRKRDCTLTGVTLSVEQLAYAQRRLQAEIARGVCDLRLQDYRDIGGTYDRIVSIEMMEAVGETYWPTYFDVLRQRLRPGGRAVLQVITIDEARFPSYRRRPDFIQKYIFPGGMLPTRQIIEREAARAGFTIVAAEGFGQSYARTLQHWRNRFTHAWPEIQRLGFDLRFKRMWDYYLAYCEAGFATTAIDVGLYALAQRPTGIS